MTPIADIGSFELPQCYLPVRSTGEIAGETALLGGGAAWPIAARAQQSSPTRLIGVTAGTSPRSSVSSQPHSSPWYASNFLPSLYPGRASASAGRTALAGGTP